MNARATSPVMYGYKTTQRYAHLCPGYMAEAAGKLDLSWLAYCRKDPPLVSRWSRRVPIDSSQSIGGP